MLINGTFSFSHRGIFPHIHENTGLFGTGLKLIIASFRISSIRICIYQPFSSTFFGLFYRFFLYLEIFKCKTTSDWLNHTVLPIRSCVTFKCANLGEKDKECS